MHYRAITRYVAPIVFVVLAGCGGGSDSKVITNPPPTVASIAIGGTTADTIHSFGDTRPLTLDARDAAHLAISNVQANWTSSDDAIATVSPASGGSTTVTAVGNGTATITARVGTLETTGALTVVQQFAALTLTPATVNIAPGGSAQLVATARDARGNRDAGAGSIVFSTSAPDKATVDQQGHVSGVSTGTATITASLTQDGVSAHATSAVTVAPAQTFPSTASVTAGSASAVFSPASVDIAAGGSVTWTFGALAHNVAFSSAGAPANIATTTNAQVTRVFPSAGVYDYECQIHAGMTGTVVVH